MEILKVVIHRIPQTPISDTLRELLHKLFAMQIAVFSDRHTINKFLAHGDKRIEVIELPPNLVLPIEVRIYFTSSSSFSLIYDSDFKWFLDHLNKGTWPDSKCSFTLGSRTATATALAIQQKKVEAMQLTPLPQGVE